MSPLSTPKPSTSQKEAVSLPGRPRIGIVRTQSKVKEMRFGKATVLSAGMHVLGPIVLALLAALVLFLLSLLLNMNIWDWFKPKPPRQDIEFTIVQDTQAKRPEVAKFKAEHNQEAGGKRDPMKPPSPVEKPSQATPQVASKPAPVQPVTPPKPEVQPSPPKPQMANKPEQPPKPPVKQPEKSNKAAPKQNLPMPTIPLPMTAAVKGPTGPETTGPQGPIVASMSQSSAASNPGPVSLPSPGSFVQGMAGHPGTASGVMGNPEGGPGQLPGVAVQQADFGPYMTELKRRLTRNWHPPRGDASKRVVLRFEIARDGRLLNIALDRTSGEPLVDDAAINAVKLSAPFRELPPEFQGESVPILFTFDYTVYGSSSSRSQRVTR